MAPPVHTLLCIELRLSLVVLIAIRYICHHYKRLSDPARARSRERSCSRKVELQEASSSREKGSKPDEVEHQET